MSTTATASNRGRRRRVRPGRGVAPVATVVVVIVAVVVGVVWRYRWQHSDHELSPYSGGYAKLHGAAGTPVDIGVEVSRNRGGSVLIDITSIRAHIQADTSGATVTVLIGDPRRGSDGGHIDGATPFSHGTYDTLSDHQRLYVRVTPGHAGTLHVAGVDVRYRHGDRTGHQRSGIDITVTTP